MQAVILAGGASRRMPGGKPRAQLWGRTLLELAIETVRSAALEPVVCARPQTALPPAPAELWREPDERPPHPLAAMAWCLEHAGRPLLFLPVDLPLLPPAALADLAAHDEDPAVVLAIDGRPAALVASLPPDLAPELGAAARRDAPVLRTLRTLGARPVHPAAIGDDTAALTNVNTPADLAALAARSPPPWLTAR